MNISKATIDEAGYLSELSFRSKAYWGYSEAFMEACREDLTILPEDILASIIFVLENEKVIKGFVGLEIEDDSCLLSNLFIDPNEIGKGYGRQLWQHMLEVAKGLNAHSILIHSDPYAEDFYLAMGARRIGEIESTVFEGRKLPLLEIPI